MIYLVYEPGTSFSLAYEVCELPLVYEPFMSLVCAPTGATMNQQARYKTTAA